MTDKPYSGSYLPRSEGPLMKERDEEIKRMITNGFGDCNLVHQVVKDNASKSTTEKFDAAVEATEGRNPGLTADYKKNGYNPQAEGWEGFCHLWAPAGLDPAAGFVVAMDKIYADVPMGIGDLRELVTYNYPRASTRFFGSRWYDKDKKEPESESLDAMDLLNIFENYVGPGKPGVVLDVDPGYMVWNQPVYSYKTESTELTGAAAAGAPAGGKAYTVKLSTEYGVEGNYAYRGEAYLRGKSWNMTVFTDAAGKVVKADWAANRGDDIPDFAWVPEVKKTNANSAMVWQIIAPSGDALSGPPGTYPGRELLGGSRTMGDSGWKTKRDADAAFAELNRKADEILGVSPAPASNAAAQETQPAPDGETAGPTEAAAPDQFATPEAFDGKTITQQVQVADTGKTATLRMDAGQALRDVNEREAALLKLKACMGR